MFSVAPRSAPRRVQTSTLRYSTEGMRPGPYQYRQFKGHAAGAFARAARRAARA